MGGRGGTTATARGGSDLTTGLGFTAGFGSAGCSGAWATGVLAAPGVPTEVGIQPRTAPIPTRLNSVIAIAAMMMSGWVLRTACASMRASCCRDVKSLPVLTHRAPDG